MSAIDILIVIVFVVALSFGLRKGIIKQLGFLIGIAMGILACRLFGGILSDYFAGENPDPTDRYISGIFTNIILFSGGVLLTVIISKALRTVTSSVGLSFVDRICGAVFSVFEWFFILSFALNFWQALRPGTDIMKGSKMLDGVPAQVIINLAPVVIGSETAQTMFDTFNQFGDEGRQKVDDAVEKHRGE